MAIKDLPKGIPLAFAVLDGSLLLMTLGLCGLAPMASNPAFVDPMKFAGLARASIRLLSINIAF
jgi:hypothetical protein